MISEWRVGSVRGGSEMLAIILKLGSGDNKCSGQHKCLIRRSRKRKTPGYRCVRMLRHKVDSGTGRPGVRISSVDGSEKGGGGRQVGAEGAEVG